MGVSPVCGVSASGPISLIEVIDCEPGPGVKYWRSHRVAAWYFTRGGERYVNDQQGDGTGALRDLSIRKCVVVFLSSNVFMNACWDQQWQLNDLAIQSVLES